MGWVAQLSGPVIEKLGELRHNLNVWLSHVEGFPMLWSTRWQIGASMHPIRPTELTCGIPCRSQNAAGCGVGSLAMGEHFGDGARV